MGTVAELKAAGYTASELKSGYTVEELKAAGYVDSELQYADYSASEMQVGKILRCSDPDSLTSDDVSGALKENDKSMFEAATTKECLNVKKVLDEDDECHPAMLPYALLIIVSLLLLCCCCLRACQRRS